MDFIETKYINLCCSAMRNFQKKGNNLYNFSCPLCSDSQTNKRKARGYIFEEHGKFRYFCHNCATGMSVAHFLKTVNPQLYKSYCFETFGNKKIYVEEIETNSKPRFVDFSIFSDLKKISELPENDEIKQFVIKRKIPEKYHSRLFACSKFMEWTNSIKPKSFKESALKYDESRLIIPFVDKQKNVIAFQGRKIQDNLNVKYYTIVLCDVHAMFGLDKVDVFKTIYVTEGPIDSMFLPNAVAIAGSNLKVVSYFIPKDKAILIFDNEKRNSQIVKNMKKAINNEYKVCIWPSSIEYKDINEGIMNGETAENILNVINENIYEGIPGLLKLNDWRRD